MGRQSFATRVESWPKPFLFKECSPDLLPWVLTYPKVTFSRPLRVLTSKHAPGFSATISYSRCDFVSFDHSAYRSRYVVVRKSSGGSLLGPIDPAIARNSHCSSGFVDHYGDGTKRRVLRLQLRSPMVRSAGYEDTERKKLEGNVLRFGFGRSRKVPGTERICRCCFVFRPPKA